MSHFSFALGIGTQDSAGNWLDVFFPYPLLNPDDGIINKAAAICGYTGGNASIELGSAASRVLSEALRDKADWGGLIAGLQDSKRPVVAVFLAEDNKPSSVPEVYLKLHLLSHRLVKPHGLNLDGMFALLTTVAWTSEGAISIADLPERQLSARLAGKTLAVDCVDKFPKMTDYVVPSGVRIADTARVRLGAYIGEGSTVMHEGFINFNAGTLGKAMIEGRISAGVVIGNNSDLGGGCSTMGTLSGGGNEVISVGENCLIGANAGIGFPLGDRCTIESGLYVTAGTKVSLLDSEDKLLTVIKARELSGKSDLLFRRNSQTGIIECKTNQSGIKLNNSLHEHN